MNQAQTQLLLEPDDKEDEPRTAPQSNNGEPSIVDDFMYGSNVATSHITIRMGFIRKVYGILSAQLALTTIIGAIIISSETIKMTLKENPSILFINFLATFIALIALMVKRTEVPANYYLLGAFTVFESLSVGFISSMYDSWTVIQAFCLTTVVVVCLTAYAMQTKRDFSSMGAILFSLLILMIFGSFFQVFFQNEILHTGLAVLGAFVFSAFIVYDTQMIMKHLHAEEYILGVINLYLDIINLFLELLKILDAMNR